MHNQNVKISVVTETDIPALDKLVNSAYRGDSSKKGWTTEADLLDGSRTDEDAINEFLINLPFNGLFVLNNLRMALHDIDGVRIGDVISAQANYSATPYIPIMLEYLPDAGYLKLDEAFFNLNVTYIAHGPI